MSKTSSEPRVHETHCDVDSLTPDVYKQTFHSGPACRPPPPVLAPLVGPFQAFTPSQPTRHPASFGLLQFAMDFAGWGGHYGAME